MTSKIKSIILMAIAFLIAFTGTALAANAAVSEDGSILDLARPVYEAIAHGRYVYAGALALILLVAVVSRYGSKYVPFFGTDWGKVSLSGIGAFGGALAVGLAPTGVSLTLELAKNAFMVMVAAMGGWKLAKMLLDKVLSLNLPAWLRTALGLVSWIFNSKAQAEATIAKAVVAGEAAVKANPGPGVAGVIGKAKDVE